MIYTDKKQITKLISYMATFDGGLYVRNRKDRPCNNVNAQFIMNMRKENTDYVEWVKDVLDNFTSAVIIDRKDYNTDGCIRDPQVRLESKAHPVLTTIRDRIYIDKVKVIDPHMLTLMDAESLAIIFMADGGSSLDARCLDPNNKSRLKNYSASITLNTKGFSYADNMSLSKAIYDKLGIRTTVNRQNKYYFLNVKVDDIIKFVNTVAPYICKSFLYKLERIAPYIEYKGGDMIWTSVKTEDGVQK